MTETEQPIRSMEHINMNEEKKTGNELPSTFSQLVIMIATSALQQLGQVPDPSGQRSPVNLEGAQGMIDILEALNVKTKGNLDEAENKILNESLTMLRLQYVEAAKAKGQQPPEEATQTTENSNSTAPKATPPSDQEPIQSPPDSGESKTRYRKSYG